MLRIFKIFSNFSKQIDFKRAPEKTFRKDSQIAYKKKLWYVAKSALF